MTAHRAPGESEPVLRVATAADATGCLAIYEPYVRDTAVTFEETPPTVAEFAGRIERALERHTWLVAEDAAGICGYAYAATFNPRPAYRWACETTVYVHPRVQGRGVGHRLYAALLRRLTERGYRSALGLVTLPNPASIGLHHALGFRSAGVKRRIGWKAGAWRDVEWLQCFLAPDSTTEPTEID